LRARQGLVNNPQILAQDELSEINPSTVHDRHANPDGGLDKILTHYPGILIPPLCRVGYSGNQEKELLETGGGTAVKISDPIIVQHDEWKYLLAALKDNPKLSYICTAGNHVQKLVLAAPLAIATFILRYVPRLCNHGKINILVIGAEWFDALDNGRWYQLISDLCGSSFKVEATLVGPDVFMENDRQTRLSSMVNSRYPEAVIIKARVEDATIDLSAFDLFVFFQPGMECHQREWMEGALPRIVKTGKPIMATSFNRDEYAMDVKYLEAHGYAVEGEPLENPFFIQHHGVVNGVSQWGRVLYKIAPVLPPSDHTVAGCTIRQK